jgi:hypothetical protein
MAVSSKTVATNFLPIPQTTVDEVVEIGEKLFPGVEKDNIHGLYSEDTKMPQLPSNFEESSKDEDEIAPAS